MLKNRNTYFAFRRISKLEEGTNSRNLYWNAGPSHVLFQLIFHHFAFGKKKKEEKYTDNGHKNFLDEILHPITICGITQLGV